MSKKAIFNHEGLTATQWAGPLDKATFLNDLASFVDSGFKRTKFTKGLYKRLSMTFGHIAHYNIDGFYSEWFSTTDNQYEWVKHIINYIPCGDPAWTFCDAEVKFQKWLRGRVF